MTTRRASLQRAARALDAVAVATVPRRARAELKPCGPQA
jgi:hypothetical protein